MLVFLFFFWSRKWRHRPLVSARPRRARFHGAFGQPAHAALKSPGGAVCTRPSAACFSKAKRRKANRRDRAVGRDAQRWKGSPVLCARLPPLGKSVFSAHVSKRRRAGLKASPDGPGGGSVALAPRVTRRVYLVLLSGSTSSLRRGATPAMHAVATKRGGGPPLHDYGAEGAFRSRAHPRFVALERHFSDLRTFCSRLLGWGIGGWGKKKAKRQQGRGNNHARCFFYAKTPLGESLH